MAVSVFLSVVIGVFLGILASRSDTVEAIIRPVLDFMQTMPAFVYLIPAILFFGLGGPPAVAATVIYALPPAVRLTNLGIRQVSPEAVEAARSFGSTSLQTLVKVQLPLARPSIIMGINQTIMMALAVVIIATFIGAGGLGYEVWVPLRTLKIGQGFEGGLAIVFMAIIFDRLGYALSRKDGASGFQQERGFKLLPSRLERFWLARSFELVLSAIYDIFYLISQFVAAGIASIVERVAQVSTKRDTAEAVQSFFKRHSFLVTSVAIILILLIVDARIVSFSDFPSSWTSDIIKDNIDNAKDWLKANDAFFAVTSWIHSTMFIWFLGPLIDFLNWLPWPVFILGVALLARALAGWRVALFSAVGLMFVGAVGLWDPGMDTLAIIIVSVFLCAIIGIPLGILAARNDTFEGFLRPILDAMQTMPPFVYLLPVVMFFQAGKTSGVIATVIYAIPPAIRLTNLGIRQVSPEAIEAAKSYGSTGLQTLLKIQLPLALPSIMLGINQAVMMALAMVIFIYFVGAQALGLEVYRAIAEVDTGAGFESGLSIVFLAIIMDRITQAWSRKRQAALGIQ